jgi:hypothetical protein
MRPIFWLTKSGINVEKMQKSDLSGEEGRKRFEPPPKKGVCRGSKI